MVSPLRLTYLALAVWGAVHPMYGFITHMRDTGTGLSGMGGLTERLQTWLAAHPRDAQAWQRLAAAYALQALPLRALRAEAEAQVARLDLAGALDRLTAAQDLLRQGGSARGSADHIEASIIDTRRRQLESLLREQALER